MLQVTNLTKKFGEFVAVSALDFSAERGQVVGFLGRNGAGKTTTMKMMTGVLVPDFGEISYDDLSIVADFQNVISNIGYLPENNPIYENLKVDEFLKAFARLTKVNTKTEYAGKVIEDVGIGDVLTKRIGSLSKGYKQRVGLAKALLPNPNYLILDEPTTGLDPKQKQEILDLIKSISAEKVVIFSSHILSEVSEIADQVVIIDKGEKVAEGRLNDLLAGHKSSTVIVTLELADTEIQGVFEQLKFANSVEHLGGDSTYKSFNSFVFKTNDAHELSLEIFKFVSSKKIRLKKLASEETSLEKIFTQLTI